MRRPSVFAAVTAVFLLAATPAFAAKSPESRIRHRLDVAIQRTAAAKSLAVRGVAELGDTGGPRRPFYRLEDRFEDDGTPKNDLRRFPPGSWTGQPTNQILAVGNRAWYRAKADLYRQATLGPKVTTGFEKELAGLERGVAVGRDLKPLGARRYELTVPSSAFNGPEVEAQPTTLVVSLSADGHLRKLRRIEEESGLVAIIAETFTDFGRSFAIAPPPADAIVEGPAKEVTTQNEFGTLLGPTAFEA
ncbi:MAG TPA: hypothetical protein VN671_08870 [Solirubrobacterales bacterium]|nr:hypothetical protein [Solirubrobacterales bacterium]